MKKYLVIADTYPFGYGCEYNLFGVFDTRDEAVKWILEHPIVKKHFTDIAGTEYEEEFFDFFKGYEAVREIHINPATGQQVRVRRREELANYPIKTIEITKGEYVSKYIHEFNGEPMYIGGYQE
jgi:hypothetical protein